MLILIKTTKRNSKKNENKLKDNVTAESMCSPCVQNGLTFVVVASIRFYWFVADGTIEYK